MTHPPVAGSFVRRPEAVLGDNPVGLAPLAWNRRRDELGEIRRLGYDGIQVDGGDPAHWRQALEDVGLRAAEVYLAIPCRADGPTSEPDLERVAYAAACGADVLVVAVDGDPERDVVAGHASAGPALTDRGWSRLVDRIEAKRRVAAEHGIPVAFHPHGGTWVETPAEIERLFTMAPELSLCLDTGHHLVAGGDPVATIEDFGSRLTHVHLKDVDGRVVEPLWTGQLDDLDGAVRQRLFAPVGTGILDIAGVIGALARVGYQGWLVVEQDTCWEPPTEAAAISRRVLEWACRQAVPAAASRMTVDQEKSGAPPGVPSTGL